MKRSDYWSSEKEDQLRQLWSEGFSGGQIAVKLRITRNAVIGKAKRLKLAPRPSTRTLRNGSRRFGEPLKHTPRRIRAVPKPAFVPRPDPFPENLVTLADNKGCKWPFGTKAPYHYCGRERAQRTLPNGIVVTTPYCQEHYAKGHYQEGSRRYRPYIPGRRVA